jgi:hypothetical protein
MLIPAQPSCLCVTFFEKLDNLLDCLDNRRMMHDSQNDALEWVHMNRNDVHYCSCATLHRLYISYSSCANNHLTVPSFLPRVHLSCSSLTVNGR